MTDQSNENKPTNIHEGRVVVPVTRPGKTHDSGIGQDGASKQERGHSTIPITVIPPDKKKD